MLDTSGDAVFLNTLNVGNDDLRGEIGVLAHIFEVTAIERCAVDVDAGAEQYVLVSVAGFLTDRLAIQGRHVGIPGCGQTCERRESDAGVIGRTGLFPFVPKDVGTDTVRAVGTPDSGDTETLNTGGAEFTLSMDDAYLFGSCHTRKRILDSRLNRLRLVKIHRSLRIDSGGRAHEQSRQDVGHSFHRD